jgi:hypothetical protein
MSGVAAVLTPKTSSSRNSTSKYEKAKAYWLDKRMRASQTSAFAFRAAWDS